MSKRQKALRPAFPAPPINARKVPAAQNAGNEPQEEVMVDVSSPENIPEEEPVIIADEPAEEPVRITDEPEEEPVKIREAPVKNYDEPEEEDEVKVYIPSKKESANEIFSDSSHKSSAPEYKFEEDSEYDIPGIIKVKSADKHLGIWVTVIIALSVMCVGAAGLYALVNGYFDSLIASML